MENSETAKEVDSIAHVISEISERPEEILDISPVKQEDNFIDEGRKIEDPLEEKGNNLQNEVEITAPTALTEERVEDISPVMVTQENTSINELLDAKEHNEKTTAKTEEDEEIEQNNDNSGITTEEVNLILSNQIMLSSFFVFEFKFELC